MKDLIHRECARGLWGCARGTAMLPWSAIAWALLMVFAWNSAGHSQAPSLAPVFEVVSVRPSGPYDPAVGMRVRMSGGPGSSDPGRVTFENYSLPRLIMAAYDIKFYELSGQRLSNIDTFDIVAKVPEGTDQQRFRLMLQNLLVERFKLAVHHEKKQMPVYRMVVAKSGPKLVPSRADGAPDTISTSSADAPPKIALGTDGYPVLWPGASMAMIDGRARIRMMNESMQKFARLLSDQLARPVTDSTDLKGDFDINLYWTTAGSAKGGPSVASENGSSVLPTAELEAGPTLLDAVQDQLGLKLESAIGPVDVLVVDHVEKLPSEN